MENPKTFEIDHDAVYFNQYDKPLFHDCNMMMINHHPCGSNSLYLITYYSNLLDRMITKHVCERHMTENLNIALEDGYTIIDHR